MSLTKTHNQCMICPFAIKCDKATIVGYSGEPLSNRPAGPVMTPKLYDEMIRRTFPMANVDTVSVARFAQLEPSLGFTKGVIWSLMIPF